MVTANRKTTTVGVRHTSPWWRHFGVWALLFFVAGSFRPALRAQSENQTLHELQHTAWTEKDGLYGSVTSLVQTPDGFLWVAATSGLYRFDGVTFEAYKPSNGTLPEGAASHLLVSRDGGLWASYGGGRIAFMKDGSARVYTEADGYAYGATRALAQTRDGAVWAAVVGGLVRFDGTSWHKVRNSWSYPHSSAMSVFVDRNDTLWVGSDTGLSYLASGDCQFRDLGLTFKRIVAVRQSRDGMLWLSDGQTEVVSPFHSPVAGPSSERLPVPIAIGSWDLLFPSDGSAWFASEYGIRRLPSVDGLVGAAKSVTVAAETFAKKDGVTGKVTRCLFEDREGNIWVGTDGGLDRFRHRRLSWTETGFSPTPVTTDDGKLFVVFNADLAPEFLPSHQPVRSLSTSIRRVSVARRSADGSTWFLGENHAWRWRAGKLEEFPYPKYDVYSKIYAIDTDTSGTVWASISGLGLMKLIRGAWEKVNVLPGDADIAPTSIEADGQGRVWLGYDARQRVALIQGGRVVHIFGPADGLTVGTVSTVAPIGTDLWVGGTGGLELLRGNRFATVTAVDGAALPAVHRIISTPHDGLWLSTGRSIAHIFEADLRLYLEGRTTGVSYELIDTETDLPEPLYKESVSADWSTSIGLTASSPSNELHTGKLSFSTTSGVATIDLAHLRRNAFVPPVLITSLTAGDRSYPTNTTVRLPPNTRSFTITYTALSLTNAVRNRFKIKLDGWDKQWQDMGTRRESSYANLAPGTYVFHVIASNNDGVWNEEGSALTIRVLPAYYQTYLFRFMCLALLAVLVWILYTWRVNRLVQRSNDLLLVRLSERERIARDLHDTFFQGIQGLLLRFNTGTGQLSPDDPARPIFVAALEQSDQVMLEGRELVLDLRATTETVDLSEILARAGEEIQSLYPGKFSLSVLGQARALHPLVSGDLYRLGKEALYNAFRHAQAEHIEMELNYKSDSLILRVIDDGKGMDEQILKDRKRAGHLGLPSMYERAERLDARLELWSRPGSGTEIQVAIPAQVAYLQPERTLLPQWLLRRQRRRSPTVRD